MDEQQWDEQIAVHVKGAFNHLQARPAIMAEQSYGRVINTSSASAFGGVDFAAYSTAKAALLGFTYALAGEYCCHGVTVNAITPNAGTPHRVIKGAQWMERVASRGYVPPGVGEKPRRRIRARPRDLRGIRCWSGDLRQGVRRGRDDSRHVFPSGGGRHDRQAPRGRTVDPRPACGTDPDVAVIERRTSPRRRLAPSSPVAR